MNFTDALCQDSLERRQLWSQNVAVRLEEQCVNAFMYWVTESLHLILVKTAQNNGVTHKNNLTHMYLQVCC